MAGADLLDLRSIAQALGGEVHGRQVLAPGPGHSRRDRSLSIRLSEGSPDGFVVHSYAGDDWRRCRDHVAAALGFAPGRHRREIDPAEAKRRHEARRRAEAAERHEAERRQRRALALWREARDPRGTVVETYLNSRLLHLVDELAGEVLRFHPACPWAEGAAPAMLAPLRCVLTGRLIGVHRTALSADGRKLGRKMLGTAAGAAVMLDSFDMLTSGLTVGEGIETCIAARQLGIRPAWALGSASGIAGLPVLPGIETLSVLGERDEAGANDRACRTVGTRWHAAGRAVDIIMPRAGKDMNDALREGGTAWH